MPVPKRKVSKSRRNLRSSGKGIEVKSVAVCATCQAPTLPHQVCKECGHYKGVKVLKTKLDRMYARTQARQAMEEKYNKKPESQKVDKETENSKK